MRKEHFSSSQNWPLGCTLTTCFTSKVSKKSLILVQREKVGLPKTTCKPVSILSRNDIGPPLVLSSEVAQNRWKRAKKNHRRLFTRGQVPKTLPHTPNFHLTPASDWLIFGNCSLPSYHQKNKPAKSAGKPERPKTNVGFTCISPGIRLNRRSRSQPCWLCPWPIWVLTWFYGSASWTGFLPGQGKQWHSFVIWIPK